MIGGWSLCDINGKELETSRLSGALLSVQGFQAVICNDPNSTYYFVVHKSDSGLQILAQNPNPLVKIWLAEDVARLTVQYGLVDWLIAKAK